MKNVNKTILKTLVISILITTLSSCDYSNISLFERGSKVLTNMGYANIESTGSAFWDCVGNDRRGTNYANGFKAKSKTGETIEGCLCSYDNKTFILKFK